MSRSRWFIAGLVATAALFSFSSCITIDHNLGSAYVSEDENVSVAIVEIPLPVHQQMADSLQTSVSSGTTFGSIRTEEFGLFDAMAVFSISQDNDTLELGDNPVFKDMYATLSLASSQQMKSDQAYIPQNMYVYQLNKELDSTMIYSCSITDKDYNKKTITLENTLFLASDEDEAVIHFTEEFAKPIFEMTTEELDSAELFMKKFYGLVIKTDPVPESVYGGRLNTLDLSGSSIYLTYESTNFEGRRRDTTIALDLGAYYSISSYKASTDSLARADRTDERILMEGLSGIKPVVRGNELREAISNWADSKGYDLSRILVSRAALVFPFEYSGVPEDYDNYPQNLFPSVRMPDDSTGLIYYNPIDEIDEEDFDHGDTNFSLFQFRSDASLFVQELLRKDESELTYSDDLWIMPTVSYSASSSSSVVYYYTDYYYYTEAIFNGTAAERHPFLRLTYSVIQE